MSSLPSHTVPNSPNTESSNGGGRVRHYEERTREMAPPEAVGTIRRSMQSSFISRFTGQRCQLQPVEHKIQRVAPEESAAATLQTHPKVQMHPLLQRNAISPSNSSKNSLLSMLAKQHNEAVQRAMEEDQQEQVSKTEEPEKVQANSGGVDELNKQSEENLQAKGESAEGETTVSPSASSAPQSPEVQTNISSSGEADKYVQAKPKGPHRTRADPAGPVRVRSTGSENAAVQMDGEEAIAQQTSAHAPRSQSSKYVQAKGQQQSGTPALESDLKSSKGAGNPMSDADRGFFESRMGADFSNVRIHTGSNAVQMNEGLGAKAFAHGSDIYFNANQYQPGTSAGKHLLAHELTHTVQQGGSSIRKSEERDGSTTLTNQEESGGNDVERMGEVRASPSVGQRLRLISGVQKSDDETAAPKIQAKCATCEAEETAAPKLSRTSKLVRRPEPAEGSVAEPPNSALNLQPSLKIGQPGDKYEQEADATADRVMGMTDAQVAPSANLLNNSSPAISPRIQRRLSQEQVTSAVDTIMDGLSGYTSASDSTSMLAQISGKSPPDVNAIVQELSSRASEYGVTAQSMVDWYLEDLTAEDRLAARTIFIRAGIPDILRIVAKEIHEDYLSGYTSDSDSSEIKGLLLQFEGNQLDNLLRELESQAGKDASGTAEWLFDDLTRLDAESVRLHTMNSGGAHSLRNYGAWITAKKVENLLAGYTSHADSGNIKGNFQRTPEMARSMVLYILDGLCRDRWSLSAEDSLMQDMDDTDYEALRTMGGLSFLKAYNYPRSWLENFVSGYEWIKVGIDYFACGIVGIITGLLSVVWDFVVAIWDIVKAIYHLMGCLLYLVTGGGAGSGSVLAVKQFFKGLAEMFKAPGAVVDTIWKDFWLDIDLIEGPLTDCRRAEYFIRKWVNLIVNVILIFVGGYGLVKGGMTGVKAVVQIIRTAGWRKGLVEIGSLILQGGRATLTGLGDDVVRVIRGLQRPVESFARIRSRITLIQQAAREEGYWRFLRRQASESVAAEKQLAMIYLCT